MGHLAEQTSHTGALLVSGREPRYKGAPFENQCWVCLAETKVSVPMAPCYTMWQNARLDKQNRIHLSMKTHAVSIHATVLAWLVSAKRFHDLLQHGATSIFSRCMKSPLSDTATHTLYDKQSVETTCSSPPSKTSLFSAGSSNMASGLTAKRQPTLT